MKDLIETRRLMLRPFKREDAEAAFGWFGDSEVMRYIPGGPDHSLGETIGRLARYRDHQLAHGYSTWIVIERSSGEPVGDAGLLRMPDCDDVDLGFRFRKASWGGGFATEVAGAWAHMAATQIGLGRLAAHAHPENLAALRVLEKVGFQRRGYARYSGMDTVSFELDVRAFRVRAGWAFP